MRLEQPFAIYLDSFDIREVATIDSLNQNFEGLNGIFYTTLRESGVLFGCPLMDTEKESMHRTLKFLSPKDQATFVNIEILFLSLIREIIVFAPKLSDYEVYLCRAVIRVIQFYLGLDIDRRFFSMGLNELINDKEFSRLIGLFEKRFIQRIRSREKFSFGNSLQNNLAFLDIYSMISWNRRFNQQSSPPIYFLSEVEQNHIAIQKQLIYIFAGLLWAYDANKDGSSIDDSPQDIYDQRATLYQKQKMLKRYIKSTRLSKKEKSDYLEIVKRPIDLNSIQFEYSEPLINKYLLEQAILLSLLDEFKGPSDNSALGEINRQLHLSREELEASLGSVADFFYCHETRFDFLRGHHSFGHMKSYINSQINSIIKMNLDSFVNEIKETGKLYNLLMKSSTEPLTLEEKRFVKIQILSIAKTIPTLAFFCLPAGSLVLMMTIKLLPFNILPNSFAE